MPDTVRPGPGGDPSPRTLEALYREIKHERDMFETWRAANDEAVRLLQDRANRQPTTEGVAGEVAALKELTDTKISSLKELIVAMSAGDKTALDAALVRTKETSDKIEANFSRQFENINANIQTLTKSFDDKINDVKDRFNTSEGRDKGLGVAWAILLGAVGLIGAAIGVAGFLANGP
jgi:hypothetical protein